MSHVWQGWGRGSLTAARPAAAGGMSHACWGHVARVSVSGWGWGGVTLVACGCHITHMSLSCRGLSWCHATRVSAACCCCVGGVSRWGRGEVSLSCHVTRRHVTCVLVTCRCRVIDMWMVTRVFQCPLSAPRVARPGRGAAPAPLSSPAPSARTRVGDGGGWGVSLGGGGRG